MIWGRISVKGQGKMAIITFTINVNVYIKILDDILIQSIENWVNDEEVIYHDDNGSCHWTKGD